MTNTAADTYMLRRERISDALEGSEALENGFEIPAQPLQYLAVERQSGDAVWALNENTLADLARTMDESYTKPDYYDIIDLDAQLYFIPVKQTVAFLSSQTGKLERIDVAPRPLEGAELATVLAALRYWQREGLMSAGCEQDIASDGGRIEPLTEGQIDELCERLNCGGDAADSSPKKPRLTQHDLDGGSCISASVTTDGELTTIIIDNRDASNLALKLSGGRITNRDDREALAKLGGIIGSAI